MIERLISLHGGHLEHSQDFGLVADKRRLRFYMPYFSSIALALPSSLISVPLGTTLAGSQSVPVSLETPDNCPERSRQGLKVIGFSTYTISGLSPL
jgi:hypothetical protein